MAILRSIFSFHYYEPHFSDVTYPIYCRAIYRIFLLYDVTSRCAEADRDPQIIADTRKDCGSFVDDKLRANIIYSII